MWGLCLVRAGCQAGPGQDAAKPDIIRRSVRHSRRCGSVQHTWAAHHVGYGRPDVDGPDPFQGVGSNTNQGRDYPIQELINEWGELTLTGHALHWRPVKAIAA